MVEQKFSGLETLAASRPVVVSLMTRRSGKTDHRARFG